MFYVIRIRFFVVLFIFGSIVLLFSGGLTLNWLSSLMISEFFIFDNLSFYTIILVLFLGVYRRMCFLNYINYEVRIYLFFRIFFSILCFCTNHSVLFWCFYELSMLPLIYLIFKESPYSERFLAGWYFCGYLLVTSLPLILILIYLSIVHGSFLLSYWNKNYLLVNWFVYFVLSFVFFTKVPLMPFHTWLPIVHAEAISIVSIFLSGYIMKLGILGVYRCTYFAFRQWFRMYLFVCCLSCIFFFLASAGELDGKRWLAFLRLAHIVIPFLAFFIVRDVSVIFLFLYCLGHGLGAGIVFSLLWLFYEICNRRNWILVKHGSVKNNLFTLLIIFSLLTLCSFPPTIQFFCEIGLIKKSLTGLLYFYFWCGYLFLGGLIPSILCGHLLVRCECVNKDDRIRRFCYYLLYLCLWCYVGFIVM